MVEITVGGGHSMLALRSFQSVMKQRKNWGYICGLLVRRFVLPRGSGGGGVSAGEGGGEGCWHRAAAIKRGVMRM